MGMGGPQRWALLRSLAVAVIKNGRVLTTEARGKEVRRYVERMVTIAKRAGRADEANAAARRVHAIRRVGALLHDKDVVPMLFEDYAIRFADRNGGYLRVIGAGRRKGDGAQMVVVGFVD